MSVPLIVFQPPRLFHTSRFTRLEIVSISFLVYSLLSSNKAAQNSLFFESCGPVYLYLTWNLLISSAILLIADFLGTTCRIFHVPSVKVRIALSFKLFKTSSNFEGDNSVFTPKSFLEIKGSFFTASKTLFSSGVLGTTNSYKVCSKSSKCSSNVCFLTSSSKSSNASTLRLSNKS